MYQVTAPKLKSMAGPAIQPMVEMLHDSDKMPDPMTAVMMWAVAVSQVPADQLVICCQLWRAHSTESKTDAPRNIQPSAGVDGRAKDADAT